MTAYVATATNAGGAFSQMGVKCGTTYQMRIAKIEIASSTAGTWVISKYTGISFSGGTAITPLAMREGAPATTATSKQGATVSGTQALLTSQSIAATSSASYQFPFDMIISPGNGLWINGVNFVSVSVYFEDLRLAWSM